MASGNVIISRNVGQTNLFVEDGKNGFFSDTDSPLGIAAAILKFIKAQDRFKEMSQHSLFLMRNVHTPDNFIQQVDEYWSSISDNKKIK